MNRIGVEYENNFEKLFNNPNNFLYGYKEDQLTMPFANRRLHLTTCHYGLFIYLQQVLMEWFEVRIASTLRENS